MHSGRTRWRVHEREHLVGVPVARGTVARLEVEAEQRLGVARAQVEPPVAEVDGEPVEAVLLGVDENSAATRSITAERDRRPAC